MADSICQIEQGLHGGCEDAGKRLANDKARRHVLASSALRRLSVAVLAQDGIVAIDGVTALCSMHTV